MKRILLLLLCAAYTVAMAQQRKTPSSSISMYVGDSVYAIQPVVTQTEYKPGWKVVDIQTNGKFSRYLWGKHSRQYADDRQPRLLIDTGPYKLTDFVLIKLKEKKEYRKFPSHKFDECDFIRMDLELVEISIRADERYEVKFHNPLEAGEYVIVNMAAEPQSEFGDIPVFPFTIVK